MGLINKVITKVEKKESLPDKREKPPTHKEMPHLPKGKKRLAILIAIPILMIAFSGFGYMFFIKPTQEAPPKVVRRSISARRRPTTPNPTPSDQKVKSEAAKITEGGQKGNITDKGIEESTLSKESEKQSESTPEQKVEISTTGVGSSIKTTENKPAEVKDDSETKESQSEKLKEPEVISIPIEEEVKTKDTKLSESIKKTSPGKSLAISQAPEGEDISSEKAALSQDQKSEDDLAQKQSLVVKEKSSLKAQRYYNKGFTYHKQGNFNQAIDSYMKALSFNPEHLQASLNLATAYIQAGRLKEGEKELNQLYTRNPEDPKIIFNYALLLYQIGEFDDAKTKLQKLLEINPLHLEANLLIAKIHEEKKETEQAIQFCRKAYSINSTDPRVLYQLGRSFDIKKDTENAVRFYSLFLQNSLEKDDKSKSKVRDRLNYLLSKKEGK
ncbi:MAG: hypothetical protein AMJ90_00990 [candidate division Zixibacteria bacterium SM23_73_2]|nr:MAG: hypothetical protein AMJ90_00990 [candidate division Zixibacteria bacterium SM23_73_2]